MEIISGQKRKPRTVLMSVHVTSVSGRKHIPARGNQDYPP